jgi:hypothetical protein
MLPLKKLFRASLLWPILITVITVIICAANYTPGTWLTGWDTLHPEFDFSLHYQRSFAGAWREDQGLGAVAAHSAMSELPRIATLQVFSLFFPLSSVRYLYVFLCFILGPLGVYAFLYYGIFHKKKNFISGAAAFLGALFYIFNLGTVQHFYVVLEMFAVQYAALGWLFFLAHQIFYFPKKRTYFFFFIACFLSAPMAYASLLWFAFAAGLGLFLGSLWLLERKRQYLVRIIFIFLLLGCANLFWLLPNLYFLFGGASKIPGESHINSLFSPESFLHNAAYGNIQDVVIYKNFLFNWLQYKDGSFINLLDTWQQHLSFLPILFIGYASALASFLGAIKSFLSRQKVLIALLPMGLLALFMIMNMNPPFNNIFEWLRNNSALFKEGLRTPFTKFSLLLMFVMACYFSVFLELVMSFLGRLFMFKKVTAVIITLLISSCLIVYGLPMFKGQLIAPKLRISIPDPYFQLFSYMKTQDPAKRLAVFPVPTAAGWEYFNWGYEGAGFIWFGLQQPVLVRDFDRWNPSNEGFYKEVSTAVYQENYDYLSSAFSKYDVSYVLLDESIVAPGKDSKILKTNEIKSYLHIAGKLKWKSDFLSLYELNSKADRSDLSFIKQENSYLKYDPAKETTSPIISFPSNALQSQKVTQKEFPFSDVFAEEIKKITNGKDQLTFTSSVGNEGSRVYIPARNNGEKFYTYASVNRTTENGIYISFELPYYLQIDDLKYSLPTLTAQDMFINDSSSPLEIAINGQIFVLKNNEVKQLIKLNVGEKIIVTTTYTDPQTGVKKNQKTFVLEENIWQDVLSPIAYAHHEKIKNISFVINKNSGFQFFPTDSNDLVNCDIFKRGNVVRKKTDKGFLYQATDRGAVCDSIYLKNIAVNDTFLMHVIGENNSGRGLKFYFLNPELNRADIEYATQEKVIDNFFNVLSFPSLKDTNSVFSFEVRSFGNEVASSILTAVELYPVPINQLGKIRVENTDAFNSLEKNSEKVSPQRKDNYLYEATIADSSQDNFIHISQGFDHGWIAFDSSAPTRFFEHVKYNGWANGWLIPQGSHNVIILYWPQLLSYGGYAVLAVTFVGFGVAAFKRKGRREKNISQVATTHKKHHLDRYPLKEFFAPKKSVH